MTWQWNGAGLRLEEPQDQKFVFQLFIEERQQMFLSAGLDAAMVEQLLLSQFSVQAARYASICPPEGRLIIERDGIPLGRLLVSEHQRELRLVDISIAPAFRQQGAGTSILGGLQACVAARTGLTSIVLHVLDNNPARGLYRKLGFEVMSSNPPYVRMEWHPYGVKS